MGDDDFEILQTALENLEAKEAHRMNLPKFISALQAGWLSDKAPAANIIVYNLSGQIIVFLPEYLRRSGFRFTETGKT